MRRRQGAVQLRSRRSWPASHSPHTAHPHDTSRACARPVPIRWSSRHPRGACGAAMRRGTRGRGATRHTRASEAARVARRAGCAATAAGGPGGGGRGAAQAGAHIQVTSLRRPAPAHRLAVGRRRSARTASRRVVRARHEVLQGTRRGPGGATRGRSSRGSRRDSDVLLRDIGTGETRMREMDSDRPFPGDCRGRPLCGALPDAARGARPAQAEPGLRMASGGRR